MKLLHIIASPRGENSRTLKISNVFLDTLREKHPNINIEELNVFTANLPEVTENVINAKYQLMSGADLNEQTKTSWDEISGYSKGFLEFDAYLITCPMWNFTIPYKLKHYIDVIMQAGILFGFTANGVEGLAKNKKMFCITSRGGDYSKGSPMHNFEFQEPYLKSIFGFAGISDITFINAQPMDFEPEKTPAVLNEAVEEAKLIATNSNFNF